MKNRIRNFLTLAVTCLAVTGPGLVTVQAQWDANPNGVDIKPHTYSTALGGAVYKTNSAIFIDAETGERVNSSSKPFSVVVIPDTQGLMQNGLSNLWLNTCQWIDEHRDSLNIVAALGVGDCVNTVSSTNEWGQFLYGLQGLTNTPFLLASGNHDVDTMAERRTLTFNTNITESLYTNNSWWSGGFKTNTQREDAYLLATNGTTKFCFVTINFAPTKNEVLWASNVFAQYPDHYGILNTHAYLMTDGSRITPADDYSPEYYGATDGLNGDKIWDALKSSKNLRMVVCGHEICTPYEAHSVAIGDSGNWVNQVFVNFQCQSTWSVLKVLTFYPANGQILARTYYVNGSQYWPQYDYNMSMYGVGDVSENVTLEAGSGVQITRVNSKRLTISASGNVVTNYLSQLDTGLIFYVPFDEGNGTNLQDYGPSRLLGNVVTNSIYATRVFRFRLMIR